MELQQQSKEQETKRVRDRGQNRVSLQVNERRSSGGRTQKKGYNPKGHNLSFGGASHGRLQVPQAGRLHAQDPCSLVRPVLTFVCMLRLDMPDIATCS